MIQNVCIPLHFYRILYLLRRFELVRRHAAIVIEGIAVPLLLYFGFCRVHVGVVEGAEAGGGEVVSGDTGAFAAVSEDTGLLERGVDGEGEVSFGV